MYLVVDGLVVSLLLTAFFSAMGLGLNLIFGVMKIVNLSQGAFFMMGSFMAISLYAIYRFNPLESIILIVPLFFAISIPIYFAFIPRLSKSKDAEIASFVLFFGLAFIIQSIALSLYGTTYYSIPNSSFNVPSVNTFGYYVPFSYYVAAFYSLGVLIFVYMYLFHTKLGLKTRALMSNKDAALLSGINVSLISVVAFSMSIAVVASVGAFSSQILFSTTQDIGNIITITSFAIIIIGGLGNPLATIAGGAVYAFSYEFASIYFPSWLTVIPFIILLVIIIIRPNGIFGRKLREI